MAKPRKLLLVNHVSDISGAERGLIDIVRVLDRQRYEPTVVMPSPGRLADALAGMDAGIRFLPMARFHRTRNPLTLLIYACSVLCRSLRLAILIRREGFALVHCNSNTAQIYGGFAARIARVPCIWHSRDLVELGAMGKVMSRLAERVAAISDTVGTHVRKYTREPCRIVVIQAGIDPSDWASSKDRDTARTALGISSGAFAVANIGQLVPWKNHALFLETAALIAKRLPQAVFLIVGADLFADHPGYRKELEVSAQVLGIADRLIFTGYESNMAAIFAGVDLVLHTADREPFGRSVVEAMAAGCPVVAVNTCGPAEIIRNGIDGMLVPPGDSAAMAEATVRLASDPDLASRLVRSARTRITDAFNLQVFANRLHSLYDDVLDKSPCKSPSTECS